MKKKIVGMLLASVMVVASLSACGTESTTSESSSAEESSKAASETENAEVSEEVSFSGKVVIDPHGAGHNLAMDEALEVLKGMDKYKDVEFVRIPYSGEDYQETMPIQIMGGEQIDIVYNGSPMQQAVFSGGDITIPLDDLVEKYDIDLEEVYGPYAKFAYTDGQIYGMPAGATAWGLFYNKSIFDEAGIPYPDPVVPMTWDEYADIALQLTSGEGGDKIYGALHLDWPMYWYGEAIMALGGGEQFYTADGMSNFEDPAFKKALERTYQMMHEDQSIRTHADIVTSKTISQAFFTGQYGMFLQGTWTLNWLLDQEENPRDFEVGLAPMPVDVGEQQKNWGVCGTYSLTQTTVDPDLAFNVIIDLIRETTKLTSSEIYADQTVAQDKLFVDICEQIEVTDPDFSPEHVQSVFINPDMAFVTEKVTGPEALDYETIMNEETELYFTKAQDVDTTIANIVSRVNAMLEEAE